MKTIEDLSTMTPTQLKGIAQNLGVNVPDLDYRKGENKAKLVQLVFDVQQPDADKPEDEADKPEEKSKEITTAEHLEAKLQEIADFYEGDIEATEQENPAGETIYSVTDVTGDEVARGTFAELSAHIAKEQAEEAAGTAALGDVPLGDETNAPESVETPPVENEDELAVIEKGLKALSPLGLRYTIDGSVVKLTRGSQTVTTTLNQPAHRVVRTAESMCNLS